MMSSCNNKFGNFDLRLACFCMQAIHIVECIGVENCPWALGITLVCHCGLEIVVYLYVLCSDGLEIVKFVLLNSNGPVMIALSLFNCCCCFFF